MHRGVARIFRGGVRVQKNFKDGAKRSQFWLRPLLTFTLLEFLYWAGHTVAISELTTCIKSSAVIDVFTRSPTSRKLWTRDGGCAAFPGTDPADSLSGCSRALSLSSRAISSSSSWSSPLLPRQEPLVSVSGSGESRSLHCLLASSSSTTASAAFGEETPVRGRHELEDPVEKISVMDRSISTWNMPLLWHVDKPANVFKLL